MATNHRRVWKIGRARLSGSFSFASHSKLEAENARLRSALRLIAAPKRPDGTYNRSREACEQLARETLHEVGEQL